jgi:hypothetical protein
MPTDEWKSVTKEAAEKAIQAYRDNDKNTVKPRRGRRHEKTGSQFPFLHALGSLPAVKTGFSVPFPALLLVPYRELSSISTGGYAVER